MDTFVLDVDYVDEVFTETPKRTRVTVQAVHSNDAELLALEIVASSGRKPVQVTIDWNYF